MELTMNFSLARTCNLAI